MKIERIHEFSLDVEVHKEEKSEMNKTQIIQEKITPNWNILNIGEILENESLFVII
jgi:hypothetical protein